jgi:hypothetical protein
MMPPIVVGTARSEHSEADERTRPGGLAPRCSLWVFRHMGRESLGRGMKRASLGLRADRPGI